LNVYEVAVTLVASANTRSAHRHSVRSILLLVLWMIRMIE
jgi:hypothetical protein